MTVLGTQLQRLHRVDIQDREVAKVSRSVKLGVSKIPINVQDINNPNRTILNPPMSNQHTPIQQVIPPTTTRARVTNNRKVPRPSTRAHHPVIIPRRRGMIQYHNATKPLAAPGPVQPANVPISL